MKLVVTGAAGRVGSRVTSSLVAAGHDVLAVDVRAADEGAAPVRVVDLCQIDAVNEIMAGVDAVCHLGNVPGMHHSGRSKGFINNSSANYNVFLAATDAGVRHVVYASSIQAYGCLGFTSGNGPGAHTAPQYLPIDEDHPLTPADAYPLSKANGEWIAESFCRAHSDLTAWSLRYTAIRTPRPPVPGEPPRPQHKASLNSMLGGLCTWIHIDDAVRATVFALTTKRPGHTPVNIIAQTARPVWTNEALIEAFGHIPPFRKPVGFTEPLATFDRAKDLLGFVAENR